MNTNETFWVWHSSGFYFRVRGYGLSVDFKSPVLFSERKGCRTKMLRIRSFAVEVLVP